MAFVKKTWKNRQSETPNRRQLTPVPEKEGVYDITRDEGCVFDEGSAFDQLNMNDLEIRVEEAFGELVVGEVKAGKAVEADTAKACTGNAASATVAASANAVAWGNVNTKPATFPPSVHTHDDRYYTEGEVNGLVNERIHVGASCNKNWNWAGQGGQPTWMWGGNDPTNEYIYNPSNFSVNYSNSSGYAGGAGNADTVDGFHVAGKGTGRPGGLAENALYFVYE